MNATVLFLALGLAQGFLAHARAADDKPARAKAAGRCVSARASVLRRDASGQPWQVVDEKEGIPAGGMLVGLPAGMIDSPNGAVRLTFLADLDHNSPYPVREAAVVLHNDPHADFALALDRGRVELANRKEKGAAHVRLQVRDAVWDLTLPAPGDRVVLELYGRWLPGAPFTREPGPKDVPTASLVFLVLKGRLLLEHQGFDHLLHAPPGPALIEWDSATGMDESPQRMDELPAWADPDAAETPVARKKKEVIEEFRRQIAARPVAEVLKEYVASDEYPKRTLAILVMGALDDLRGVAEALKQAKYPDLWDKGVLALRHWIGRGPGQDQKLYNALVTGGKFSPVHAETIMQLLHSFGEADLAMPETYQMLIDYLEHDKLAIRGLAHWHLYRLAPAGREIGYSPMDSKEAREEAVRKWRKLIPPGTIPSRVLKEGPAKGAGSKKPDGK